MTEFAPIFIAIPVGAATFCMVKAFVEFLKRNLDQRFPNSDDEGEIEALLAAGLQLAFSHPHGQTSSPDL
ncbi:hypothetical protein [Rhizobium leguminosarum]